MDRVYLTRLWDIYHNLLTDTQREISELYFNMDLTVSEIAAEKGISRQAVSECLGGCRKALEEYEEKTGVLKMLSDADERDRDIAERTYRWADGVCRKYPSLEGDCTELRRIFGERTVPGEKT